MNSDFIPKEKDRPVRQSLCSVLRRNSNLKCLILTFLIHGCLVAIIWCRNTQVTKILLDFDAFPITRTRQVSPCDDGVVYIPTAFVVMLYLLYLVECWHSKARVQLSLPKTGVSTVYRQIQEMREAQPIVWWKAICYHYTRRIRQVTRYRNGTAYTSSQVFYERVNSHAMASYFFYSRCGMRDISKDILDLEKYPATKIKFSKNFVFANVQSAAEFEEQRTAFFQEQGRLDDYMEMRESLELSNSNFKESVIAWATPESLPWFAKNNVFWISSFLLLSWPIRILLELNTAHLNYRVTKMFGINYPSISNSSSLDRHHQSHRPPLSYSNFHTERQRRPVLPRILPSSNSSSSRCLSRPIIDDASSQTSLVQEDDITWQHKKGQGQPSAKRKQLLPRSVTLMINSTKSGGFESSTKSSFSRLFLNFESDEEESLIPTYSEALLLMDPRSTAPNAAVSLENCGESRTMPPNSNLERPRDNVSSRVSEQLGFNLPLDEADHAEDDAGASLDSSGRTLDILELPPTYLEALRTSRPVFLPPFAQLRRCFTERDLRGRDPGSMTSNDLRGWLNTTSSYFLQRFGRRPAAIISAQVDPGDLGRSSQQGHEKDQESHV